MGTDDDIALSLPEPPPPRPARRDAAIDEALRRFDAAGDPSYVAAGPRHAAGPPPWWTRISRPQVGVLVSAALVALIGVPVTWLSIEHNPATFSQEPPTPTFADAAAPRSTAPAPIARPSPPIMSASPPQQAAVPAPATVVSSPVIRADSGKASCGRDCAPGSNARAKASPEAVPAPTLKVAQGNAALSPPPPPPPALAAPTKRAEQGYRAEEQGRFASQVAPAPRPIMAPPPLPPRPIMAPPVAPVVAARAAEGADTGELVVTGSRRTGRKPAGRGDWNACTVNDPVQSLSGCRKLVDPGAKGPAGRAAARVADGLSLAWQGDFDGAIAAFDQAIDIAPRSSFAYLNRGLAHQRRGELDRAIADLDQAVRYAPGAARGYYNRSVLLHQRGDARHAAVDEDRAVDIDTRYEAVVK
jgi:hypothetical protein